MTTQREYIDGDKLAKLTREQVKADWGQGDGSDFRIALANRAFTLYYQAAGSIRKVGDSGHRTSMWRTLSNARAKGFGLGISDLNEAFEHLAKNNGIWTDNNTENYYGGPRKCFNRTIVSGAPEGMVNFLDAVDDGMKTLGKVLVDYKDQLEKVTLAAGRDDWETVGTVLGHVNTAAETAEPWLWTAPATQKWAGRIVTFTDVTGKIHDGATMYVRSKEAGFDNRSAAALTAMRLAVGCLPVLGGFYSKAVEMIPGLVVWYRGLLDQRFRDADRASRED